MNVGPSEKFERTALGHRGAIARLQGRAIELQGALGNLDLAETQLGVASVRRFSNRVHRIAGAPWGALKRTTCEKRASRAWGGPNSRNSL